MADYLPFDEFRLVVRVPENLEEAGCDAIRRLLESLFGNVPSPCPPSVCTCDGLSLCKPVRKRSQP